MGKRPRHPCVHNTGIVCRRSTCEGCSWDPEENQRRKEMIRERVAAGQTPRVVLQKA